MKAIKIGLMIFLTMNIHCYGQEFNGYITYKVELKNPMPDFVSDSAYYANIGGRKSYLKDSYYQGKEYKSVTYVLENSRKQIELLNLKSNKLFTYIENSDSATYVDISSTPIQIIEIRKNTETEKVLDVDCQSIKIVTNMGEFTFYFSKKYSISPDRYIDFKYGLFDRICLEINAVPLKIETKNMFMHTIETAIKISQDELSEQNFILPDFKFVVKSIL